MKCNKCLKIIPKGEEIRFSSHDSSYRGDGGGYSGCYCEDCWKNSSFYRGHEDSGKKSSNSSNGNFPSWGYFVVGFFVGVVIALFIVWLTKRND